MTRAVASLFPLGIVAHMLLLGLRKGEGRWISKSVLLLVVYGVLLSTWTIHNLVLWDRFVILSDQLMPSIWRAAVTNDGSPSENDQLLLQDADNTNVEDCQVDCKFQHETDIYVKQIQANIGEDPVGYVLRRSGELATSALQPHGTVSFGSASIRDAATNWLENDRSATGLIQLTQIEGFAIKLVIWILHFFAILFGLIGIWWTRRSWDLTAPLVGFLVYTMMIHFVVLDAPRYLFPNEIIWLVFASITVSKMLATAKPNELLESGQLMNILIATGNIGKLREYQRLFAALDAKLLRLNDLDLEGFELEETGNTFEENAALKAKTYARLSNHCTVADDSGLTVDALNGAPGIYSARYGGEQLDNAGRRRKLLAALEGVEEQKAQGSLCLRHRH